jgi:hypothetical protein
MYLAAPYTIPHCAAGAYDAWLKGRGGWIFGIHRSSEMALSESSLFDYDSKDAMEFYTRKMYFFSSRDLIIWDTNRE